MQLWQILGLIVVDSTRQPEPNLSLCPCERWKNGQEGKCHLRSRAPVLQLFVLPVAADFEEPEDPSTRSFFSEIISSISDVKFSHNGRYLMTRDYLTVKVWDLQMENKPLETYQVSLNFMDLINLLNSLKITVVSADEFSK